VQQCAGLVFVLAVARLERTSSLVTPTYTNADARLAQEQSLTLQTRKRWPATTADSAAIFYDIQVDGDQGEQALVDVLCMSHLATAKGAARVPRHLMKLEGIKVACSTCRLRELCLPAGLSRSDLKRVDQMVESRRTLERGEVLFRNGDRFDSLYVVWTGFFKTRVWTQDGIDQVMGFQMSGDLLGLDGIAAERHACEAVALADSQVCQIPYARLEDLARDVTALQRQFHKVMSREITRDHIVMVLLGSMRVEARLSAFLLNLIQRLKARGFSGSSLVLHMSREEIGSYLGMKLETVSRTLSRFQDDGLLEFRLRDIRNLDEVGLHRLLDADSGAVLGQMW